MEQLAISWEPVRKSYTVAELSARIRDLLGSEFDNVWVAGEISGCRIVASGHCYFTLKDEQAQVRCVCFRSSLRYLKCKPRDGMSVLVRGHLDVYEARGEYQLLVEAVEPQGLGALQFAFEQLKKKLAAEGLFETARKRALPKLPGRIGLITSPTGAVIQDMLQILARRFPGLHIRLYPALVQGEGSIESVCRGIEYFSRSGWAHVVILARGGGSLEDLWTFNEEAVARAIAACTIPMVSAIGHESDFTIADFVADLRAATPSAAAELVICTRDALLEQLTVLNHKMLQSARYRVAMSARRLHQLGVDRASSVFHRKVGRALQRVDELEFNLRERMRVVLQRKRRLLQEDAARLKSLDLRFRVGQAIRRLESADVRLAQLMRYKVARGMARLDPLTAHLTQLSPLKILDRGYAVVTNDQRRIVRDPADAAPHSQVRIRVALGQFAAKVLGEDGPIGP